MINNNLSAQLRQIGLIAVPGQLDDFIAHAAKARWSAHQMLEELVKAEAARALAPQPGAPSAQQRH